jgi:CubicO group peptidase (beta-lactamase class C family)
MNVETGLAWHEDWRSNATGTNDTLLGAASLLDYVLAKPVSDEPGTLQRYSTGDPALLSGVLQLATGKTAFEFGKTVLFDAIGIPGVQWNADGKGRTTTYAGLQATVREFAKFGELYKRGGEWDGTRIVPADWVHFTTVPVDHCNERYRYLWHVNPPVRLGTTDPACADFPNCPPTALANLPSDGFFAEGVSGQFIFVFPSADLVVARVAQDDFGSDYWDGWAAGFLEALFDALSE